MSTVSRHEDALQMYYLYTNPYDYDSLTVIMASRIVWSAFLLLIFVYNFKEINAQVSAVLYLTLCVLVIFCHASVVVCESFQNLFFYLKRSLSGTISKCQAVWIPALSFKAIITPILRIVSTISFHYTCASVYCCLVVTCWEMADFLAFVCDF